MTICQVFEYHNSVKVFWCYWNNLLFKNKRTIIFFTFYLCCCCQGKIVSNGPERQAWSAVFGVLFMLMTKPFQHSNCHDQVAFIELWKSPRIWIHTCSCMTHFVLPASNNISSSTYTHYCSVLGNFILNLQCKYNR